jgi:hypothetical protein
MEEKIGLKKTEELLVEIQVLTAMGTNMTVFWDVPCNLVTHTLP